MAPVVENDDAGAGKYPPILHRKNAKAYPRHTGSSALSEASPPSSARGYYGTVPDPLPTTPKLVLHESLLARSNRQSMPLPVIDDNARTTHATQPVTRKPLHIRVNTLEVITVYPATPETGITIADVLETILRHPQRILQSGASDENTGEDLGGDEDESTPPSGSWKGLLASEEGNDIWVLHDLETAA